MTTPGGPVDRDRPSFVAPTDDLQREIFTWMQDEIQEHVETAKRTIDILSLSRKLERIADLATNIAEDVVFLIEGALIRHTAET